MEVTNSKGDIYKFSKAEMRIVFMYAFGYSDISRKGFLPIHRNNTMLETEVSEKLGQCFKDEYELIQKVIGGF